MRERPFASIGERRIDRQRVEEEEGADFGEVLIGEERWRRLPSATARPPLTALLAVVRCLTFLCYSAQSRGKIFSALNFWFYLCNLFIQNSVESFMYQLIGNPP